MSVHTKEGCKFDVIAPAGFRILSAIERIADEFGIVVTITSGTDGVHPAGGAQDPHYLGEAYDIRTHDLPDKQKFLSALLDDLNFNMLAPNEVERFYAFIEFPSTPEEHIHCQLRNGATFV